MRFCYAVILNAVKDPLDFHGILRFAQNDNLGNLTFFTTPLRDFKKAEYIIDIQCYLPVCGGYFMDGAIGIFDSGVGGLTVFEAVRRACPQESLVYLGDTARVPYGAKSADTVIKYSIQNAHFLVQHGIKALVVACNTSSAYSLSALQKEVTVPVIGVISPGVDAALIATSSGRIGVIGTKATVASGAYAKMLKERRPDAMVISQACPLFVPLVEEGWLDNDITRAVAKTYLEPFTREKIDVLILGCTHYPLLKPVIKEVVGGDIKLIDSAEAVAARLKKELAEKGLLAGHNNKATSSFYVTDMPVQFELVASKFLGHALPAVKIVEL